MEGDGGGGEGGGEVGGVGPESGGGPVLGGGGGRGEDEGFVGGEVVAEELEWGRWGLESVYLGGGA